MNMRWSAILLFALWETGIDTVILLHHVALTLAPLMCNVSLPDSHFLELRCELVARTQDSC